MKNAIVLVAVVVMLSLWVPHTLGNKDLPQTADNQVQPLKIEQEKGHINIPERFPSKAPYNTDSTSAVLANKPDVSQMDEKELRQFVELLSQRIEWLESQVVILHGKEPKVELLGQ